jgi:hypothetical protein
MLKEVLGNPTLVLGGGFCASYLRTPVTSGPLLQGTDPGLIAQRGAPRAAGRARLLSGDPS